MSTIAWLRKATRRLSRIPACDRIRIIEAVDTLIDLATAKNIPPLKGNASDYRLRVGGHHVLFTHEGAIKIIDIQELRK